MTYTAITILRNGKILNKYFSSSHNASAAWEDIARRVEKEYQELVTLVPGKHEIITEAGRLGYNDK